MTIQVPFPFESDVELWKFDFYSITEDDDVEINC